MGKFNKKIKKKTFNYEGEVAYKQDAYNELYTLVTSSFCENTFYESNESRIKRLRQLINLVEPEFVCKLAIYARESMYLRTIPIVLMIELLKNIQSQTFDRRYLGSTITRIIKRADEITEFLSYYAQINNRNGVKKLNRLAKQLQFGIAGAFKKFDEYQFAKYNRQTEITIRDALFLTHPKACDEKRQILYNKIAANSLQTPYTWEVELSTRGNNKEVWEELIDSGKLGYMALLRNLRNILNACVSQKYMTKIAQILSSKEHVFKSKQLPVRFYAAYREIEGHPDSSMFLEALEKAVRVAVNTMKFFKDKRILIASDVSGSMMYPLSKRSKVQYYDIGLLLSMLLREQSRGNVTTGIFGDIWKVKNFAANNILANTRYLSKIEGEVGYSTNGYKVLEWALNSQKEYDRIIFFTDCQLWDSHNHKHIRKYWRTYKKQHPNTRAYFFNLAGYGTSPIEICEHDVYMISGFSDKIFDMLNAIEKSDKVIHTINAISLYT